MSRPACIWGGRMSEPIDRAALARVVEESDVGGRTPGPVVRKLIYAVALCWSLFQLWYASPLPFLLNIGVIGDTAARAIHLSFALFLAFTAYPAFAHSPRDRVPLWDWLWVGLSLVAVLYLVVFYDALALRPGLPTRTDV